MRMPLLLPLLLQCCLCSGADLHVDPLNGDDARHGVDHPVRTIGRAIHLAQPGDTIHLQEQVYRDWAAFFDKSGEPGRPITLDGHGATLDGCDPLDPAGWQEVSPGLFRHDDLLPLTDAIIDRWFFLWNGRLNRMNRCSKGPSESLKAPADLQQEEWTFVKDPDRPARPGYVHGSFYLRLPEGQSLADAKIEIPVRTAGVLIRGRASHLVIRNLTATRPYNDGFNLSDSRDIVLENIRAIDCGDDGISAHGDCQYTVDRFTSIGNATGICDTGSSVTSYRHVFIRDCIGFDLFFLDNGRYSISDSFIRSSAVKSLYLQGRPAPVGPCRLTLDNVVLQRDGSPGEVRVSSNCRLSARRVSFLNLDVQATGGDLELDHCYLGGQAATEPPRPVSVHLWKDATWQARSNWYDLGSLRVAQTTYAVDAFSEFQALTLSDQKSVWKPGSAEEARSAEIGALEGLESSLDQPASKDSSSNSTRSPRPPR